MKKPWDTWVLKGLTINEAAPLFEKMERIQMEPWGHAFGWKYLTLADGRKVKLTIQKNGIVAIYTAIASGNTTVLFRLLSGLFYTSVPTTPVIDGEYRRIYPHNWETRTYGPWQYSTEMAGVFDNGHENSFYYKKGTMYTGLMRKVVQLLGGGSVPIPFDYKRIQCHGIYVNPQTQDWWVIEISAANGVSAWKLPIIRYLTGDEQRALNTTFPIVPSGENIKPDYRVLASAADITDAYTGSPLYDDHGWAFNYTGTEAQTISVVFSGYKKAFRWKLAFSADSNGEPISATLTLEEEKYVYGSRVSAPKYPVENFIGMSLVSLDMFYDQLTPPDGDTNAPLDVFYLPGQDEPIIVRYGTTGVTEVIPIPTEWPPAADNYTCGAINIPLDLSGAGTYEYGGSITKTSSRRYSIDGFTSPIEEEQAYTDVSGGYYNLTWNNDWGYHFISNYPALGTVMRAVASNHYTANLVAKYPDTIQLNRTEVFFKPFYDREAICLYTNRKKTRQTGIEYLYKAGASGGIIGYECGITPSLIVWSPASTCSYDFRSDSLGGTLFMSSTATEALGNPVDGVNATSYCPGFPGEKGPTIEYARLGNFLTTACTSEQINVSETSTLEESETIFILDSVNRTWSVAWESPTIGSDPYSEYIETVLEGSQLFLTYFDAFSGQGMSYATMNNGLTEDLYLRGSLVYNYDLNFATPGFGTGWFGVP